MGNVLVVGSINTDLVIRTDRMPALGETIVGYGFSAKPGGKGANQAVSMARLGNNVKMIGAVGRDEYGKTLLDTLRSNGVGCEGVKTIDIATGTAMITVCRGDNSIIIDHGANQLISGDMIQENEELFRWADIVAFQFEIPESTVLEAAKMAKQNGCMTVLNPAPVMHPVDPELLELVDVIIPNEYEAASILGMSITTPEDEETASIRLSEMGVHNAIITLGNRGSILYDGKSVKRQEIFNTSVVDTTAAGDSYVSGICTALSNGLSLREAMRYATAVSAVTVSREGAIPSLPTREEVSEVYRAL